VSLTEFSAKVTVSGLAWQIFTLIIGQSDARSIHRTDYKPGDYTKVASDCPLPDRSEHLIPGGNSALSSCPPSCNKRSKVDFAQNHQLFGSPEQPIDLVAVGESPAYPLR